MRRFLLFILAIPTAILLLGITWTTYLKLRGYYPNIKPDKLAEHIVKEGKDPKECYKLYVGRWHYPSEGSLQDLCVFMTAQLKKDPLACESLLPGEYGLGCIAEVWQKLETESHCGSDGKTLYCETGTDDMSGSMDELYELPAPSVDHCDNNK